MWIAIVEGIFDQRFTESFLAPLSGQEPIEYVPLHGCASPEAACNAADDAVKQACVRAGDVGKIVVITDADHNLAGARCSDRSGRRAPDAQRKKAAGLFSKRGFPGPHFVVFDPEIELLHVAYLAVHHKQPKWLSLAMQVGAKEAFLKIDGHRRLNPLSDRHRKFIAWCHSLWVRTARMDAFSHPLPNGFTLEVARSHAVVTISIQGPKQNKGGTGIRRARARLVV